MLEWGMHIKWDLYGSSELQVRTGTSHYNIGTDKYELWWFKMPSVFAEIILQQIHFSSLHMDTSLNVQYPVERRLWLTYDKKLGNIFHNCSFFS